jgi:hypothetical protein
VVGSQIGFGLVAGLTEAHRPALRELAREWGNTIRAEDGVGEAIRLIEQYITNLNNPMPGR